MKTMALFVAVAVKFSLLAQSDFKYELTSTLEIDLDGDGKHDRIMLYSIEGWNDPGEVQRIEFELSTLGNRRVDGIEPAYVSLDREEFLESTDLKRRVDSNQVFVFGAGESSYVLLKGYPFASTPGFLSIFSISPFSFKKVFNQTFELNHIYIENKTVCLVGRANNPEVFGKQVHGYEQRTYAPYLIYALRDAPTLLEIETERYNIEHYAGYFGPKPRTDIPILQKRNEKPFPLFTTYRKYPNGSLERLSESDLIQYSRNELRLMRNEIFASYGRKFNSADLSTYFESQTWYEPKYDSVLEKLTEIEKANVALILKVEQSK